jgi:hypothetical protein
MLWRAQVQFRAVQLNRASVILRVESADCDTKPNLYPIEISYTGQAYIGIKEDPQGLQKVSTST